jgi:hypothetical protein
LGAIFAATTIVSCAEQISKGLILSLAGVCRKTQRQNCDEQLHYENTGFHFDRFKFGGCFFAIALFPKNHSQLLSSIIHIAARGIPDRSSLTLVQCEGAFGTSVFHAAKDNGKSLLASGRELH